MEQDAIARYRSRFEAHCAKALGPAYRHEAILLPYILEHTYLPDFVKDQTIIEAKGRFTSADRTKMLAVQRQYPEYTIILWFQSPNSPICKGSKTTYRAWAIKHGFQVR